MKLSLQFITVILFLVPFSLLLVTNQSLFPFITGKALFFRVLITLALLPAIWLILHYKNIFNKKDIILIGLVCYYLAYLLGTIFSVNSFRSFWGNAERMEGLWGLSFFLLYGWLLILLFKIKPEAKKTILYSFLIVNFIISFKEILQKLQGFERPSSTLGNATYIGFFSVLSFFLILSLLFKEKNKSFKIALIVLLALNVLSILFSETRGSILALGGGIFFMILFSLINIKNVKIRSLLLISLISFSVLFYFFLHTKIALEIPGLKRVAHSIQDPSTYMARVISWQIFLDAFKERPLFGYGPENMPYAFYRHFRQKLFHYEEAIFDRPHNKYIEVLASNGIVGFILWLIFIITAAIFIFKSQEKNFFKPALLGFFVSYLIQNFTLFDMQASYLLLFFGIALATEKTEPIKEKLIYRPNIILNLIGIISFLFLLIHIKHWAIVTTIITALRSEPARAAAMFLKLKDEAGPFKTEMGLMASNYINSLKTKYDSKDINTEDLVKIIVSIERASEDDPLDVRLSLSYLNFLSTIILQKKSLNLNYKEDIARFKDRVNELLKRFEKYPDIRLNVTTMYALMDQLEEAREILDESAQKFIFGPRTMMNFGLISFQIKNYKTADIFFNRFLNYFSDPDKQQLQDKQLAIILLQTFVKTNNLKNIEKILKLSRSMLTDSQFKDYVKNILKENNVLDKLNLTNI